MDLEQLQEAALQLSEEERAILARSLIVSLDADYESEIEQAWVTEASKRASELENGDAEPVSAETVREKAKRLLR